MSGRRPADTLLVAAGGIKGTSRRHFTKLAFDFAVTSPFALRAIHSSVLGLSAAQQYSLHKRRHLDTQEMCESAGIGFEPIVFESTGGLEPEASGVIDSLIRKYGETTGLTFAKAKERLMQRISLILVRSHHRALSRRRSQANQGEGSAACRVVEASETLVHDGEW